ncbi:MAG: DUF2007 domain-containing protein [Bacteroidaceae bacterium]|nr:DUF2007 domain-containing protein [Bacteroidaceae bacterium]
MSATDNNRLVQVFAGTLWQAQLIKGLLDSNNIQCTVLDETIGAVTSPYSPTAGDAVVAVNAADELRALAVIEKEGHACK